MNIWLKTLLIFVFPSVDPQTLEGLDVVFILSCRHVRQEQPDWEARDPFN